MSNQMLSSILYKSKIYLDKNASTILTVAGAIGVVATAISTAKATKALTIAIYDENIRIERRDEEPLTKTDIIRNAIPYYTKPVLIGLGTVGCIVGANILDKKKQASLTSAYVLLENTFNDYKNKVFELYGADGEERVRAEIVKDHIPDKIETYGEHVLFYDSISDRYFERTMEQVWYAEYHFNRNFILRDYAKLNEFYKFLGLDGTNEGEVLGWSTYMGYTEYGYSWVDFTHTKVELEDGMECYIIDYPFRPSLDYLDY